MKASEVFFPARRTGIILHLVVLALLAGGALFGLWQAGRAEVGPAFLLALLPAFIGLGIIPWLGYCLYALRGANYTIERDGLRLRWGLRQEVIPIDQIQWVRRTEGLSSGLPMPFLRWPGAVLGQRSMADGRVIEYLAERTHDLVLIATPQHIFAISPAHSGDFLSAYERYAELGSISPLPAQSTYPAFLLSRFWKDRPARSILLSGAALSLLLWVWVILAVPGRGQIPWYLSAAGQPGDFVPAVRLLLLPTLNLGAFVFDLVLGFFFYRREEFRVLAYLFWLAGLVTAFLFAGGIFFTLNYR